MKDHDRDELLAEVADYLGKLAESSQTPIKEPKEVPSLFLGRIPKDDFCYVNAFYRSLKFLGYKIDFLDYAVDISGKLIPKEFTIVAADINTKIKIRKIEDFLEKTDIERIYHYVYSGAPDCLYGYLIDSKFRKTLNPLIFDNPSYAGVLASCYMASFEKDRQTVSRIDLEVSPQYLNLYENLVRQGIKSINPEDMGLLYAGLISQYQLDHKELLPDYQPENQ